MADEQSPQRTVDELGTIEQVTGKSPAKAKRDEFSMRALLEEMIRRGASDLHITVGAPPILRIDGRLHRIAGEAITEETSKRLAYSIMAEKQKQKFVKCSFPRRPDHQRSDISKR